MGRLHCVQVNWSLKVYLQLSCSALAEGKRLFMWRPKFHYFEHMLDNITTERLHPRLFWNYGEEDVIGAAIGVACRTHRLTAPERTCDRYYIRLLLALKRRETVRVGKPDWLDECILNV